MRLNQFLARSGVASRRKAEDLIISGKVTVNGKVVTNLATEVDPEKDEVTFEREIIKPSEKIYLAFNKPTGYTTTKSDPYALHTIFELLPEDPSLFPVGRLDRETSGLIIITNDGDFAQNIIHPKSKIEKEYIVRTLQPIEENQAEELLSGVDLDDGLAKAKQVKKISEKEIELVIEMGRNRVVRRMIAALGNKVTGLKRVRIGVINLDVDSGKYRELTGEEIARYA